MAINKNHEFEDLDGVKCAIVEKNVLPGRVEFLKKLLEYNSYTVVVVKSPPPKVVPPKPVVAPTDETSPPARATATAPDAPPAPETFTVGVTDVVFNATNAIMGRALHTRDGHVVTLAYWHQKETMSHDEVPYYEKEG
jgi:hypothetical protein